MRGRDRREEEERGKRERKVEKERERKKIRERGDSDRGGEYRGKEER